MLNKICTCWKQLMPLQRKIWKLKSVHQLLKMQYRSCLKNTFVTIPFRPSVLLLPDTVLFRQYYELTLNPYPHSALSSIMLVSDDYPFLFLRSKRWLIWKARRLFIRSSQYTKITSMQLQQIVFRKPISSCKQTHVTTNKKL